LTLAEKKPCVICEGRDFELLQNEVRFGKKADVLHCHGCGLIFLDQASFSMPEDFYEKEYHQTYLAHVEPSVLDPQKYYEKMLKVTAPWSKKLRASLGKEDCVLDLGCSTGHLMSQLKDDVGSIHGHDLNEKETKFAREVLGLDVDSIPLTERFDKGSFDAITMIFVFEHIAEPMNFLNYIKPFLKKNGKVFMLVPNIKDPLVSLYDLPEFRKFYFCIEHLFYYSLQTLQAVCSKAGYRVRVECIQEYPVINHLNWIYKNQPMDVIASRSTFPHVSLLNANAQEEHLRAFWASVNENYQAFLSNQGHGDRIWAELSLV